MTATTTYQQRLDAWNRQAADLSNSNWPSGKIRMQLMQQGCPERLARKIATRFGKKRGMTLMVAGALMLVGWLLFGVLQSAMTLHLPGIIPMALLVGGLGTVFYGLFQFLLD